MIFYFDKDAGSLMCAIQIKGLTRDLHGWTIYNWWKDPEAKTAAREQAENCGFSHPFDYDYSEYYGGYRHFVAESMSRRTAEIIVKALGGYLIPEIVPPSHQLTDGGPFHVHLFSLERASSIGKYTTLEAAIRGAESWTKTKDDCWMRVYDNCGCLIADFNNTALDREVNEEV